MGFLDRSPPLVVWYRGLLYVRAEYSHSVVTPTGPQILGAAIETASLSSRPRRLPRFANGSNQWWLPTVRRGFMALKMRGPILPAHCFPYSPHSPPAQVEDPSSEPPRSNGINFSRAGDPDESPIGVPRLGTSASPGAPLQCHRTSNRRASESRAGIRMRSAGSDRYQQNA